MPETTPALRQARPAPDGANGLPFCRNGNAAAICSFDPRPEPFENVTILGAGTKELTRGRSKADVRLLQMQHTPCPHPRFNLPGWIKKSGWSAISIVTGRQPAISPSACTGTARSL